MLSSLSALEANDASICDARGPNKVHAFSLRFSTLIEGGGMCDTLPMIMAFILLPVSSCVSFKCVDAFTHVSMFCKAQKVTLAVSMSNCWSPLPFPSTDKCRFNSIAIRTDLPKYL